MPGFLLFMLLIQVGLDAAVVPDRGIASLPGRESRLILGISGHPLSSAAYNANSATVAGVSYDVQIDMLKSMGLEIYRVDVYTNASGRSRNHDKFVALLEKCRDQGISVLPMIYDRCRYTGSPMAAYEEGFAQMAGFARLYGAYLTHFELGNEMELFDKLRVSGDGRREENYDPERIAVAAQYIRGMEEGLKSVKPQAKSMVNTAGYLPVFWMDKMMEAAPSIDICAWHVYPEMPPLYRLRFGIGNIHDYLYNRYRRPIWYTETNSRARADLSEAENAERSSRWSKAFREDCMESVYVEAVIYHELLDNPERGGVKNRNYEEEHFGFVRFEDYPGKKDEAAYQAWASRPDRYQRWAFRKAALDLIQLRQEKTHEHSDL